MKILIHYFKLIIKVTFYKLLLSLIHIVINTYFKQYTITNNTSIFYFNHLNSINLGNRNSLGDTLQYFIFILFIWTHDHIVSGKKKHTMSCLFTDSNSQTRQANGESILRPHSLQAHIFLMDKPILYENNKKTAVSKKQQFYSYS